MSDESNVLVVPEGMNAERDAVVLTLKPGDTLVLMSPNYLSIDQEKRLAEEVKRLLPDYRVVILNGGMRFGVLRQEGFAP